ncbi:uncharacterized protein LOC124852607 [Hippoglossus stenolepis]|uniref:uncharacterized protein LOC124852607 n=1 Tax=Hippoglossus stenolepis TaxID=195615 RepID=UPI001FAFB5A5|nr:uncharacterized protein LOC124852607 [Hippoglossus stenolepis]
MAEWRICVVVLLFVGYCLLQVCGPGNVTCTVTQGTDQTTYSVPDEGASGCSYSWANASDTGHSVLANQAELTKDGPVRIANVSTFITSECFPQVIYRGDCLSEKEEHTSNCTIVCREKVVPPEGPEFLAGSCSPQSARSPQSDSMKLCQLRILFIFFTLHSDIVNLQQKVFSGSADPPAYRHLQQLHVAHVPPLAHFESRANKVSQGLVTGDIRAQSQQ